VHRFGPACVDCGNEADPLIAGQPALCGRCFNRRSIEAACDDFRFQRDDAIKRLDALREAAVYTREWLGKHMGPEAFNWGCVGRALDDAIAASFVREPWPQPELPAPTDGKERG
jgi:hypothetical protein